MHLYSFSYYVLISTIFLTLLIVSQCSDPCVSGYKILVRQTIYHNTQNQPQTKSYTLKYRCLCPADYFGPECAYHVSLYCFLQPYKNINFLTPITQQNYQPSMNFTLNFTSECYIDHYENKAQMVQLREYLNKYNKDNKYGVDKQFGEGNQIIWANTTEIFDKSHEFKVISEYNQAKRKYEQQKNTQHSNNQTYTNTSIQPPIAPTAQLIHSLTIGSNTHLFTTPFDYTQHFLSYPLSHSKIKINLQTINPDIHGVEKYLSYQIENLRIDDEKLQEMEKKIQDQIKQRVDENVKGNLQQEENKGKQLVKDILSEIANGNTDIKSIISKYTQANNINKADIDKFIQQQQQQPLTQKSLFLPTISIPITLTPQTFSFYNSIQLQLSISQTYLTTLTHNISMNSLSYHIPIINSNNFNLGQPIKVDKNLILTDRSFKSYFKVIIVVIIAFGLYFGVKFGYKKYMKRKAMEYTTDTGDWQDSHRNTASKMFTLKDQTKIKANQIQNSIQKHIILNEEK